MPFIFVTEEVFHVSGLLPARKVAPEDAPVTVLAPLLNPAALLNMLLISVTEEVFHPDKSGLEKESLKALLKFVTVEGNCPVICPKTDVVPLKAKLKEEKLLNVPKLGTSNIKSAPDAGTALPSPLKFPVSPG